jgi:hypothetical protein
VLRSPERSGEILVIPSLRKLREKMNRFYRRTLSSSTIY